jgi:hypothetical protein
MYHQNDRKIRRTGALTSLSDLRDRQGGFDREPIRVQIRDVLLFNTEKTDFDLSQEFLKTLEDSSNPLIVMFVGGGRVGKSERLNQLLTQRLGQGGPFESDAGADPIITAFQFCRPIRFADFSRLHNIELTGEKDPDFFLVDCEGLHSLSDATPSLKKATFALAQMSSLTVLVVHGMSNYSNIDSAKSLFVLSRAFTPDVPGFVVGTVVMMPDISLSTDDPMPSLDERDAKRREQDSGQTAAVLRALGDTAIVFDEEHFKVLAQPGFEDEKLYWKSMEDLLGFATATANVRSVISGRLLCGLFNEAKPAVMEVTDFENPNVPFEQILSADPKGCPVAGAARARPHKERFNRKEWIIKKKAMQRKLGQKVANNSKYTGRSRRRWI